MTEGTMYEIPDPISALQADPHFSPWAHSIAVRLDGELLKFCVAASAKEGWVKLYVRDSDGEIVANGSELVTEIKRGKVELSWMEPPK
jgi:hypothetical protein